MGKRTQDDRDREARAHGQPAINADGEVVLELANGYSLRSGAIDLWSGEYIYLATPDGREVVYWHYNEWQDDPILVMGAIINTAINAAQTHAEGKRTHQITLTLDDDDLRAIAWVRAGGKGDPADYDGSPSEAHEHLEGFVELAAEEMEDKGQWLSGE